MELTAQAAATTEWLHGVEHVTRDDEGNVYWKEECIEQFLYADAARERQEAIALRCTCMAMERHGLRVSMQTYIMWLGVMSNPTPLPSTFVPVTSVADYVNQIRLHECIAPDRLDARQTQATAAIEQARRAVHLAGSRRIDIKMYYERSRAPVIGLCINLFSTSADAALDKLRAGLARAEDRAAARMAFGTAVCTDCLVVLVGSSAARAEVFPDLLRLAIYIDCAAMAARSGELCGEANPAAASPTASA